MPPARGNAVGGAAVELGAHLDGADDDVVARDQHRHKKQLQLKKKQDQQQDARTAAAIAGDDDTFVRPVAAAAAAATSGDDEAAAAAAAEELAAVPYAPFEEVCQSGWAVTRKNFLSKVWRYTIVPIKEVYLPLFLSGLPTNFLMLTFRTFNRDFDLPNHNADHLAPLLRDALMPARGKLHREKSPFLKWKVSLLDTAWLGLPGIVNFVDVRTQWFDHAVSRAIADGIQQVVVIAAGYDTRAYRLAAPGVRFYEVDLPHASEKKQELVRELLPREQGYSWPEFVAADLSKVCLIQALTSACESFDPAQRTLFMIEGLIYYLPCAAVKRMLSGISEAAATGSRLFFDFLNLDTLSGETFAPGFETLMVSVWNKGEPMRSGFDRGRIPQLFKPFGFKVHEVIGARDIAARFHPHVTAWRRAVPHVPPYFSYAAAEKI